MEMNGLRTQALSAIERIAWIPKWGKDRISGMIASRPDWCISRQRAWGVPITVFSCKACGHLLLDNAVIQKVAERVSKQGTDVWFTLAMEDLYPGGFPCPKCRESEWNKEEDILDVWFDSGVSHAAVLEPDPNLAWPADLYLEGSDQHRGWFHSSLLEAMGTRGKAPYKSVLTHGFVVDGNGRKMSKSAGNVVSPQEIFQQHGAEILRLWVAAEDYRDDIRISKNILVQLIEAYRRIRNTCRFLIGNIHDYDPDRHRAEPQALLEIDRWALYRLQKLIQRVRESYDHFEFHMVYHALYNFCVVDMSSLYLDILKDRLYTFHRDSRERRSAQQTLHEILSAMTRLMAPVLSFTSEEIWAYMHSKTRSRETVHLADFPEVDRTLLDEELAQRWDRLLKVRGEVFKSLETVRKSPKKVDGRDWMMGHSLEACVELYASGEPAAFLRAYENELPSIFIVSGVTLHEGPVPEGVYRSEEIEGLGVNVRPATGDKCERCWNYRPAVGQDREHPTLCDRCTEVVRAL
jgi:isoleucyl-tRNA synthetase